MASMEQEEDNGISFHPDAASGFDSGRIRRDCNFSLPDGRKAHIAASPGEESQLRERLIQIYPDGGFQLFISGSDEHIEALRTVHKHHEQRRDNLRREHSTVYNEIEAVREDMENISRDLRNLSDHGVLLDANFSKYGYAAHLRTYNGDSSHSSSRANLFNSDNNVTDHHAVPDWTNRTSTGTMKFYKRPTVRQYFHKGLLWRGVGMEEVLSFELFVDLLYVGIIAVNGDMAAEQPTREKLLHFSITFVLGWKLWSDLTLVISWFETGKWIGVLTSLTELTADLLDDILQRIGVLFVMSCLFGYTTNITTSFDPDSEGRDTYTQLIAFFVTARAYNGLYFLLQAYMAPIVRGFMFGNALTTAVPSALWISSIYVDMPKRLGLILIAIALDIFAHPLLILFIRYGKHFSEGLGDWVEKVFDFYPAVNIEHKTERTKQFVTLVFGYSVVALLYQNSASMGVNGFFGKAVLGIVQTFCQNWIYFEIDGARIHVHAIRRHVATMIIWNTSHLPFIMAEVLSAAALSRLVITHDSPSSNLENLTARYQDDSESEIDPGIRWFYCGGLATSFLFMSIISLTHIHKTHVVERIRESYRVGYRMFVLTIMFCLPLARSLNSLHLVATTTGLVVTVLLVDMYGTSNSNVSIFVHDSRVKHRYTADVKTRNSDLEHALATGQAINVSDLAK